MCTEPFFSIIIVSFNAEETIRETVESVLRQEFENYEIIVKDACSKDDTVYRIPEDGRIKVYITEDTGIYDGMNEAITYAAGRYLLFLNCGDCLRDRRVLSNVYNVAKEYNRTENGMVIYGDYYRGNIYCKQPSKLTPFYLYRTPLCHQTMFIEKILFERYGNYECQYKICADYDFTLKTFRKGVRYIYCEYAICNYLGGGVSESDRGVAVKEKDYRRIKATYYKKTENTFYGIVMALTFRRLRQRIVSDKSPMWIKNIYHKIVNVINN